MTCSMESTLQSPATIAARPVSKSVRIAFCSVTVLLCLWMALTAYAQFKVPDLADAYRVLGFPSASFRVGRHTT